MHWAGPRPTRAPSGSLAVVDGRPVGAATIGRIYMYPPDYDALWATINVLPEARRRGVGSALLEPSRPSRATPARGFSTCRSPRHVPTRSPSSSTAASPSIERQKVVRLDLVGHVAPPLEVPDGVDADHARPIGPTSSPGIHAVALETFADIPGGDRPMAVGDLAEFRARDVDPLPPWGFIVATDDRDRRGRRVREPRTLARTATTVGWHDMTAVAPRLAWPGTRDRPQDRDDPRRDRARVDRARDRQRRRQRADARGERPPRLPAAARTR